MNAELTVQVNKIEVASTSARKIEISSVGKQGAVGDKGDVGNPGISAYQLAVDNGFEGDEAEERGDAPLHQGVGHDKPE